MPADRPVVVVAVDPGTDYAPALRYAMAVARTEGCDLHLVHVVVPGLPGNHTADHGQGRRDLATAAERARSLAGGSPVRVSTELAHAPAVADVLVRRGARARLLVLQRRPHPATAAAGGTYEEVARRARSPVVLLPADEDLRQGANLLVSRPGLGLSPAPEALP